MTEDFSPRQFLRDREALLVHFNTVMGREELPFPQDLLRAISLKGVPLSFSTIQVGDTPPSGGPGGAEGSVGLIVDIGPKTIIKSVYSGDSGSSEGGSLGKPPTAEHCAESIDKRNPSNEWHVQDFVPVGILLLQPLLVRMIGHVCGRPTSGEVLIDLGTAIQPFAGQRIFGLTANSFLERDPADGQWKPVAYADIIPE